MVSNVYMRKVNGFFTQKPSIGCYFLCHSRVRKKYVKEKGVDIMISVFIDSWLPYHLFHHFSIFNKVVFSGVFCSVFTQFILVKVGSPFNIDMIPPPPFPIISQLFWSPYSAKQLMATCIYNCCQRAALK